MITIQFHPWGPFRARKDPAAIQSWLQSVGEAAKAAFIGGMGQYPPASAEGAWPNNRSGNLRSTIAYEVTANSMTIGSNAHRGSAPYSLYLRTGTSRMKRRKMSDDALKEGMHAGRLGHWVEWTRG